LENKLSLDEKYMQRCIELATKGLGYTYPNPLVGSVIVYNNKIISEGWHKKAGENHAEIEAIENIHDKSILQKSTLYVNLEPCSHFGKTNPCADRIIKEQISRVVIGTKDFSKKINGKGIEKLKKAGCKVKIGILDKECIYLNRRFFSFHLNQRPYIILKWAESKDGFMAPSSMFRNKKNPFWLSNIHSIQKSHKWRAEEQAILIGVQTVIDDDPSLTVRSYSGNNPLRIILDPNNRAPDYSKIITDNLNTLIINSSREKRTKKKCWKKINFKLFKEEIIKVLNTKKIQSIIIEGGSRTLEYFIENDLFDEIRKIKTQLKLNNGIKSPKYNGKIIREEIIKGDVIQYIL
tara:strand:- start:437 stop:1483 length:1047 start_codon:yes stop_codon:yes gene_type:complete